MKPKNAEIDVYVGLDENECDLKKHNCHPDSTCINTKGSFNCSCNHGYYPNGSICLGMNS